MRLRGAMFVGLVSLLPITVGCGGDPPPTTAPTQAPAKEAPAIGVAFDPAPAVRAEAATSGDGALPTLSPPAKAPSPAAFLQAARARSQAHPAAAADVMSWIRRVQKVLVRAGFDEARVDGGALAVKVSGAPGRLLEARIDGLAGTAAGARFLRIEGASDNAATAYFDQRFAPFEAGGYYVRPHTGLGKRACKTNVHDATGSAVLWQVGPVLVDLREMNDQAADRIDGAARAAGLYGEHEPVPEKTPAVDPFDDEFDMDRLGKEDPVSLPDRPFEADTRPFIGTWRMTRESGAIYVLHFEVDGSYRGEQTRGGKRQKTESGTWSERGDRLVVKTTKENGKPSDEIDELPWRVEWDRLHLRIDKERELVFDRLVGSKPKARRTPSNANVLGTWKSKTQAMGQLLLELRSDGTFQSERRHFKSEWVETGTWVREGGVLHLTVKIRNGKAMDPHGKGDLRIGDRRLHLRIEDGRDVEFTR